MSEIRLTLPIPNSALWPNARVHWAAKAKAVKAARKMAWAFTLSQVNGRRPMWDEAETRVSFFMPSRRRVDRDNAQASLKAYWDGIADAGTVANDAGLIHYPPEMCCDKANPRVEIRITEVPPATLTGER